MQMMQPSAFMGFTYSCLNALPSASLSTIGTLNKYAHINLLKHENEDKTWRE